MSASTAPARAAPDAPEMVVEFSQVPDPVGKASQLIYDDECLRAALAHAGAGAGSGTLVRVARGAEAAPAEEDVQRLERRIRSGYLARARRAAGWSAFWWLVGPAVLLLWLNYAWVPAVLVFWLPPLALFVASRGASSGGPVLGVLVSALPLIWAWRRALAAARESNRWRRAAGELARRRYRASPLRRETDERLARFSAAAAPQVARLRSVMEGIRESGAEGVSELAALSRGLYRTAVRHGLPAAGATYHALYEQLSAAERRLTRLERGGGGLLSERKAAGAAGQAARAARRRLAQLAGVERTSGSGAAPALGTLAGLAALVLAVLLTGTYYVPAGQAAIVDPPGARLARLAEALGWSNPTLPGGVTGETVEVDRLPGLHLGWPGPFADHHTVTLEEQRMLVRARFRPRGQDAVDVLVIEVRYQITDLERWAVEDQDGNGEDRLSGALSGILEDVLQRARRDAGQVLVQQQPALADNQTQLVNMADQLVENRMDDLVRAFVGAMGAAQAPRESGVRIGAESRWRIDRGVPMSAAGAGG